MNEWQVMASFVTRAASHVNQMGVAILFSPLQPHGGGAHLLLRQVERTQPRRGEN